MARVFGDPALSAASPAAPSSDPEGTRCQQQALKRWFAAGEYEPLLNRLTRYAIRCRIRRDSASDAAADAVLYELKILRDKPIAAEGAALFERFEFFCRWFLKTRAPDYRSNAGVRAHEVSADASDDGRQQEVEDPHVGPSDACISKLAAEELARAVTAARAELEDGSVIAEIVDRWDDRRLKGEYHLMTGEVLADELEAIGLKPPGGRTGCCNLLARFFVRVRQLYLSRK